MPTTRTLLTGLFLGLPFVVAPAILFAAPRPDVQVVAQTQATAVTPTATLAASPSGKLKVIPASGTMKAGTLAPCAVEGTPNKARGTHGYHTPHRLVVLN
ncbi:MAG: hypothetical protein PW843_01360 [Azospirillaceae bacterium]|nr:hypothetical protein [Azospirillaceae bacterium]